MAGIVIDTDEAMGRFMAFKQSQEDIEAGRVDTEREPQMYRPCQCGCDYRDGATGVGYLHGIKNGQGFTLWVQSEAAYMAMRTIIGGDQ